MWFGLLGPLCVQGSTGRGLTVAGARLRVLLAALLMRHRQVVPADELAEIVWDGFPPTSAPVTLRGHVKRLRQGLGAEIGARIITRPAGYSIEVSETELDVLRFSGLCARGSSAARASAWNRAAGILSEALTLWRGAPLADIPSEMLRCAEAPHLDELRLQAIEFRIEADLEIGHLDGLVCELQALTTAHPLRERFHAQLMLALYESGRQADALATYQQARGMLVDQLGIEPSRDLQNVHRRILSGDHPPPGSPVEIGHAQLTLITPRQLPTAIRHFTGRSDELAALTRLLDQTTGTSDVPGISVIEGTGGIGKTTLAVFWAHHVADRFPDGELYINLRGSDPSGHPVPAAEAIRDLIDAFGVPPERVPGRLDAQVGLYRSLLAERRLLVVIDDATDAEQVRPLLPGSPGCLALITTRNQLTSLAANEDADLIMLDTLSRPEAHELLVSRLGRGKLADDADAAEELVTLCAGLPLALTVIAACAAERPASTLKSLAEELEASRRRLGALQACLAVANMRAARSYSDGDLRPPADTWSGHGTGQSTLVHAHGVQFAPRLCTGRPHWLRNGHPYQ